MLLAAYVRLEPEMLRLVADCALQFLVCETALNAPVLSTRQYVDKRCEDGLPSDTSAPCVMIIR